MLTWKTSFLEFSCSSTHFLQFPSRCSLCSSVSQPLFRTRLLFSAPLRQGTWHLFPLLVVMLASGHHIVLCAITYIHFRVSHAIVQQSHPFLHIHRVSKMHTTIQCPQVCNSSASLNVTYLIYWVVVSRLFNVFYLIVLLFKGMAVVRDGWPPTMLSNIRSVMSLLKR